MQSVLRYVVHSEEVYQRLKSVVVISLLRVCKSYIDWISMYQEKSFFWEHNLDHLRFFKIIFYYLYVFTSNWILFNDERMHRSYKIEWKLVQDHDKRWDKKQQSKLCKNLQSTQWGHLVNKKWLFNREIFRLESQKTFIVCLPLSTITSTRSMLLAKAFLKLTWWKAWKAPSCLARSMASLRFTAFSLRISFL